ncbi:hypothetical protein [Pararhodospirillum oryzae]|uniref:Uncharacterized protein n=1 Tax=Pararhodospirillum oryzae TaxID=478448 RepID=A0A512H5C5_9PROT|nr:hypothetical protein [Pararhodospirillum oryzae]GEO80676.1 hypothetical protein ROR02_08070 [Pararhodospirillum oryzae]
MRCQPCNSSLIVSIRHQDRPLGDDALSGTVANAAVLDLYDQIVHDLADPATGVAVVLSVDGAQVAFHCPHQQSMPPLEDVFF